MAKKPKRYDHLLGFLRCHVCRKATLCVVDAKTDKVIETPKGWENPNGVGWLCDECTKSHKS